MELTLRPATLADASLLGAMNRQLGDDEHSRNSLDVPALVARMEKWLSEDWQAVVIESPSRAIGYALFQIGHDYYNATIPEVYVRQFFIARDQRGQGIGRRAFDMLLRDVFPPGAHVHLDVLATNPRGARFWETLGFHPFSTALRRAPG